MIHYYLTPEGILISNEPETFESARKRVPGETIAPASADLVAELYDKGYKAYDEIKHDDVFLVAMTREDQRGQTEC